MMHEGHNIETVTKDEQTYYEVSINGIFKQFNSIEEAIAAIDEAVQFDKFIKQFGQEEERRTISYPRLG